MTNFVAVIPVKGRSTRLPGKNMVDFCGKPLVWYTINAAIKSKCFSDIILSTDSTEIINFAESNGLNIRFKRPSNLCQDETSTFDVVKHALNFIENEESYCPDYVAILEATSPLRLVEDIRKGVNLQVNSGYDGVVSVVKADNRHPLKSKIIKKGKLKSFMEAENTVLRSQDLPDVFFRNGAFFSFNVDFLKRTNNYYKGEIGAFEMPEERSVDINTQFDMEIASFIMKSKINV